MAENDWKSRLGVVFSTNSDFKYQTEEQQVQQETLPPQKQRLRVFLEKKNRGGKQVTVVEGFAGSEDDLQQLGRMLKTRCGVGGSVKDGQIIVQGDLREKVVTILEQSGYNAKRGN